MINMSEGSAIPKPPRRIRLGKLPYVLGIGGTTESKDMKLMFIEKATNRHYTFRIITDQENGRLVFEMHTTDEEKKHKAIQEGKPTKEAYDTLIRMILDIKALQKDAEKIGKGMADLAISKTVVLESNEIFAGKTITPISKDNKLMELKKGGKEGHIDDEKLMTLVSSIHGVEDLDKQGYAAAAVQGANRTGFGAVFKKKGKWYYLDMMAYGKEALLLFEPYLTIEGKMTKEEFINALKADSQLARLPASV